MKRKSFLQTSAALVGGSLLPATASADNKRKKSLRFAHLTDIHVKPGIIPESGMAKAFQSAQDLRPKVEFIINGGDSIMDALEADKVKTQTQWDLFKNILKKENSLPVYHTIGNHDIWGWFIKNNRPEDDHLYGKIWAMEELGLAKSYYSFIKGNWHFIVLDSVQLNPAGGYIGKLGPEQMEWLQQELTSDCSGPLYMYCFTYPFAFHMLGFILR
jgi:predicted MPP superfamily phosphohydrolase